MAANPITEHDLAAYCRRRHIPLSIWEGDLIFRVDDAVLAVWAEQAKTTSASNGQPVPISDAAGVRALLLNKGKLAGT